MFYIDIEHSMGEKGERLATSHFKEFALLVGEGVSKVITSKSIRVSAQHGVVATPHNEEVIAVYRNGRMFRTVHASRT